MTSPVRIAVIAVSAIAGLNAPAFAQASAEEFTTAAGETLALPPIDQMECDEMEKMLNRIDSTGYRKHAPVPHDDADIPLFEYELALAEQNFHRCVTQKRKTITQGFFVLRRIRRSESEVGAAAASDLD